MHDHRAKIEVYTVPPRIRLSMHSMARSMSRCVTDTSTGTPSNRETSFYLSTRSVYCLDCRTLPNWPVTGDRSKGELPPWPAVVQALAAGSLAGG